MRAWRKLYATILDSDQVSALSDGAVVLLCLLIVAQDDTGYWPWTPAKVRHLVACRPNWNHGTATQYAEELISGGIAGWVDGGILLLNGEALNGRHRSDNQPMVYSRSPLLEGAVKDTSSIPQVPPRGEKIRGEKIRVEESRVEESRGEEERFPSADGKVPPPPADPKIKAKSTPKRAVGVTPEYLAEMVKEFPTLNVDRIYRLKFSPWCKSHQKQETQRRLVDWLEKDARDFEAERKVSGNGRTNATPERHHKGPPANMSDAESEAYYGSVGYSEPPGGARFFKPKS